jgi:hypothetical protein
MGSNEPLGTPTDLGDDNTSEANIESVRTDVQSGKAKDACANSTWGIDEKERGGKRRKIS